MPVEPSSGKTSKSPRYQGSILFLFGLPFFLGGFFFGFGFMLDGEQGLLPKIFGGFFGLLFVLIGGAIVYGGIRIMLGRTDVPKGVDQPQYIDETWETSRFFPKSKAKRSARGGAILWRDPTKSPNPFSFFFVVLLWNGFIGAFFYFAFYKARSFGFGEYFGMAVLSLFALVGLLMIVQLIKRILQLLITGTLGVELGEEPLRAGEKTRLLVTLARDHQVSAARVTLECQETTRHSHGTNTVTTKEVVLQQVVHEREEFRAFGGHPCLEIDLIVPPDAMHSFSGKSNEITWFVSVFLDIPGKPDIKERYEFRVAPGR